MNREIKFKFLLEHKESKERVITRSFTLEELINCYGEETILESHHCDCQPVVETNVVDCNCDDYYSGFEIVGRVQFTGLVDKNKVDIYESDIVLKKPFKKPFIVYFDISEGGFCCKAIDGKNDMEIGYSVACDIEVVGNIHENSELLNEV